jgi:DNA-binding CsgD family transcriptional regulator
MILDAKLKMLGLSPQEMKICGPLAQGLPRKRIAEIIGISTHTLDIHLAHIRKKLRRETTAQTSVFLAQLAVSSG